MSVCMRGWPAWPESSMVYDIGPRLDGFFEDRVVAALEGGRALQAREECVVG